MNENRSRGAITHAPEPQPLSVADGLAARRAAREHDYWSSLDTALADSTNDDARADVADHAAALGFDPNRVRADEAALRRVLELRAAVRLAGDSDALATAHREAARKLNDHVADYGRLRERWLAAHAELDAARARAEAAIERRRLVERELAAAERAIALRRDPAGVERSDDEARRRRERAQRLAALNRERAQLARDLDALTRGCFTPAGDPALVGPERERLASEIARLDDELREHAAPAPAGGAT